MKIGIICGHGEGDPGALGCGYKEADLVRQLAPYVKKCLDPYAEVVILDTNRNWYKFFKNGGAFSFKGYDYIIELHCNAGVNDPNGNGATTGIEIWVTPREKAISVEQAICKHLATLGLKNRGVKRENFLVINCIKDQGISACLIENGFIGDRDDVTILVENMELWASKIAAGVAEGFGLKGNGSATTPPSQTTGELYRVRKSWNDVASQIGAYKSLDNAKRACTSGYSVYNSNGLVVYSNAAKPNTSTSIVKGDRVTPIEPVDYYGTKLISAVTTRKYTVIEVKGDRVVLGDGLNTAFKMSNLKK